MKKVIGIMGILFSMSILCILPLFCFPIQAVVTTSGPVVNNTGVAWNALPDYFNVTVEDSWGDEMFINWSTNMSGSWVVFGSNVSVTNGSYTMFNISWVLANFSACDQPFYWRVNVSNKSDFDATSSDNKTYNFTVQCNTTILNITANIGIPDIMTTSNTVFSIIGTLIIIAAIMAIVVIVQKYR